MSTVKLKFPHPGEILLTEFLEPLGITQYRLGIETGIPHSRVTRIIQGKIGVSPETALRLSRYLGTSAEFWLGLQQEYDLRAARSKSGASIEAEVSPLELAAS